jgi:predicted nucleotidyltransferase
MNNKISELVKKTLENLDCEKIILFGSRARSDFKERSDYDILVVVKTSLTIEEKMRLTGLLRKGLAKIGIDADIIVKSKDELNYYKEKIGSVVRSALKEGVAL